jgi:tetratricopeptide (TPR) repeat protein
VPPGQGLAQQLQALGGGADTPGIEAKLATLDVHGPPPPSLAADIERYSTAMRAVNRGAHANALPLLADLAERHSNSPVVLISYSRTLKALSRNREAQRALERALAIAPCSVPARLALGDLLGKNADYAAQVETLRRGIVECPESYELLNDFAYVVATVPDDDLRDGSAAVRAAERAVALTGRNNAGVLDTLAAAHAEAGDFESAVAASEHAVRLARQQGYPLGARALFEQSLARYQAGQPMRVP